MMLIFKNKKGEEKFGSKIILILFSVFLLILSIILVYSFMTNIEVKAEYRMENIRFNNAAARIMYSPDCFASSSSHESELGSRTITEAGVLDFKKINKGQLDSCIKNLDYGIIVSELDENLEVRNNILEINTGLNNIFPDKKDNVFNIEPCTSSKRKGKFIVLIKKDGMEVPGLLTLCVR